MKNYTRPHHNKYAFTLIELLVVISIIALLIGILLPALGAARDAARQMKNSTQVRGIHQAFVTFAQSNKGFFPGLISFNGTTAGDVFVTGTDIKNYSDLGPQAGAHPAARYMLLLNGNFVSPDYLISPGEIRPDMAAYDPTVGNGNALNSGRYGSPTGPLFYSYALPQIHNNLFSFTAANKAFDLGRRLEWSDTINAQSIAISDRLIYNPGVVINNDPTTHQSVWTDEPGEFGGSITWNDNHVEYSNTSIMENTRYGNAGANATDAIYQDVEAGVDRPTNAKMVMRQITDTQVGPVVQ